MKLRPSPLSPQAHDEAVAKRTRKVALLTLGTRCEPALQAAAALEDVRDDVGVTVADARFMKVLRPGGFPSRGGGPGARARPCGLAGSGGPARARAPVSLRNLGSRERIAR